jgi:uncharacterized repeat protein (TIGR03803 family)
MRHKSSKCFTTVFMALACVASLGARAEAQKTLLALYNFTGGSDGGGPNNGIAVDAAGNFYGTTWIGGISSPVGGNGVVFELSLESRGHWVEKVLYSFGFGIDGRNPTAGVVFVAAGNLYGTTTQGGQYEGGTVYELSPTSGGNWAEKIIHSFGGFGDGGYAQAGLVIDSTGNLFGTTVLGGVGDAGVAFELSPSTDGSWTETVLQNFTWEPTGPLVMDPNGNLYGTSSGYAGGGSVYELTPAQNGWEMNIIYGFQAPPDGSYPASGVTFGPNGHLYGVTEMGGTYGIGTAFELVPSATGTWTENQLYSFGQKKSDPIYPAFPLIIVPSKGIWGVGGSGPNCGGLYFLSPGTSGWTEKKVYSSTCQGLQFGGVSLEDSAGNLFGPAGGFTLGGGIIYEFIP